MPLSGEGALVHIKQVQGKGKSARDLETAEVVSNGSWNGQENWGKETETEKDENRDNSLAVNSFSN